MNFLVDIIGYIGSFILGAVCLEIFWYGRRRRIHDLEEREMNEVWKAHIDNDTEHCPFSDEYDEEIPSKGEKE